MNTQPAHSSGPRITQRLPISSPDLRESFAYDVSLFSAAINRQEAHELMEGLSEAHQEKATGFLKTMSSWDSGTRQGQLVNTFGPQMFFRDRLHKLFSSLGHSMRREVFHQLPIYCQTSFRNFEVFRKRADDGQLAVGGRSHRE